MSGAGAGVQRKLLIYSAVVKYVSPTLGCCLSLVTLRLQWPTTMANSTSVNFPEEPELTVTTPLLPESLQRVFDPHSLLSQLLQDGTRGKA